MVQGRDLYIAMPRGSKKRKDMGPVPIRRHCHDLRKGEKIEKKKEKKKKRKKRGYGISSCQKTLKYLGLGGEEGYS